MLKVFNNIDEYAPGFSSSVIGYEVLSPPDLEETFGLTGGVSSHLVVLRTAARRRQGNKIARNPTSGASSDMSKKQAPILNSSLNLTGSKKK